MPPAGDRKVTDWIRDQDTYKKLKAYAGMLLKQFETIRAKATPTDVTHDALVDLLGKKDQFRGESRSQLIRWMKRSLHNMLLMDVRRRGIVQRNTTGLDRKYFAKDDNDFNALEIASRIDRLPETQQKIILCKHKGYSNSEICSELGITDNQLAYQLKLIRKELEDFRG